MSRNEPNLDERLLRLARTAGHTPARERAVARFSKLGEHGGVWLPVGLAGATPEHGGSPGAHGHPDGAELSERPRLDVVRGRACVLAPGPARGTAVRAGGGPGAVAAVPGRSPPL